MISIIHPSRSRAVKSIRNISDWYLNSTVPFELIVSLDNDDPEIHKYRQFYSRETKFLFSDNKSSVEAINAAAKVATGDILMVVSDDTECFKAWDYSITNSVNGKTDWILKTQDGIQPWIITLPIMDRAYYNRFGYIYHPGYQHLFCDTELTCVADILGRKITSNLLFPHNHYSIGRATLDSVYSKNDRTNEQGEKLFLERYARNFDLPQGYKIQGQSMIDWLKKRGQKT